MLYYLTAVVFGMVGLNYAAVPLYRTFCQATGYGGTVQRKEVYLYIYKSTISLFLSQLFLVSVLIFAPLFFFLELMLLQTVEEKIARHSESGTVTERWC